MLTLPRFFAFTVAALALLTGVILTLAVRTANHAVIKIGEAARRDTATRVAATLEAELSAAEHAIADFEQALALKAVWAGDHGSLTRYLIAELIAQRGLADLTLTGGTFLRYDQDGDLVLAPDGRYQVQALRDRGGQIATRAISRVAPDGDGDPTRHDTFRTAAHQEWRGRSVWSDLAYAQGDAALPAPERRRTLTVQKAIFDQQQHFVGVLRAGIVSDTLDRFARERAADDPHRLFICDGQGRLLTRLHPNDSFTTINDDGAPDPDGDLRVLPRQVPPAVGAALALARRGQVGGARVDVEGQPTFITMARVAEGRAQDWLVGVVVPESAYVGDIAHARDRLLLLMIVVVAVIGLVGLGGARAVGAGLRALVQTTDGMQRFSFDAAAVRSPFAEVRSALTSVERAKTALRAMVKYVPIGLVRRLYASDREPMLGADLMDVSLMFTDIADFTSHAEALPPARLAEALGRYLQAATAAVEANGGTVDKYIGDALMVLWNAPDPIADHPIAACRAALACAAATDALGHSAVWRAAGLPPWRTRFGLHADQVLVGHFGAPERLSYTAMGDGVNLAARLEGLNKMYGTTILVSEALRARVAEAFIFRQIDRVAVKGKAHAIAVYELLGIAGDPHAQARRIALAPYEQALAAMQRRDFTGALALLAALPDDEPATVLARRCQAWQEAPPPTDWDGTWVAVSK